MRPTFILISGGLFVNGLAWMCLAWLGAADAGGIRLLNASYDPTRELWRSLNAAFVADYETHAGQRLTIRQSHGGSGAQARAVIDGLPADVVTLALWSDTNAIRQAGLIKESWEHDLPNRSLPFYSTIVFVVRRGNPKAIRDWPDLAADGVQIISPNPKTSGNGKLALLAAWGSVTSRGGSAADAEAFVTRLYRQVPVLDTGARGATTTFAQNGIGDVHLTWENEAHLEVDEAKGALEIIYPPTSIRAEPFVTIVDAVVDRKGTRDVAEEYLRFLYTTEAQEIIARHGLRPIDPAVAERHRERLKQMNLFPVSAVARDWGDAQERYFADGGVFDRIYQPSGR